MPTWLAVYLVVFGCLQAVAMLGDLPRSGARWLLAESGSALCLVLVAVACWIPAVRAFVAPVALPMFVLGMTSLALGGARSLGRYRAKPGAAGRVRRAAVLATGLGVLVASIPLAYWGFGVAVLGNFARR